MKTIAAADARQGFKDVLKQAQSEAVVIMSHGRPVAVIVGVKGCTIEGLFTQSAEFWRMIEARRAEVTEPFENAVAELEARWSGQKPASKRPKATRAVKSRPSAARTARKTTPT